MDIKNEFSGDLTQTLSSKKSWAFILPFFVRLLSFIPIHRDSKRGRSRALQVRVSLLVVGIIFIAFGKALPFIAIGSFCCFLILFIPLSESRKRSWVATLKTSGMNTQKQTHSVNVSVEKKKINISGSELETSLRRKKPRKIWDKGFVYVGFRDENKDRFWFRAQADKNEWPVFEKNETVTNVIEAPLENVLELSRG